MASQILCSIIAVAYCIFLTSCASPPPERHAFPVIALNYYPVVLSSSPVHEVVFAHPSLNKEQSRELQYLREQIRQHVGDNRESVGKVSLDGRSLLISIDKGSKNVFVDLEHLSTTALPVGFPMYPIGHHMWMMQESVYKNARRWVVNSRSGFTWDLPEGTLAASYRVDGSLALLSLDQITIMIVDDNRLVEIKRVAVPDFDVGIAFSDFPAIVCSTSLTRALVWGRWGANSEPGRRLIDLETGEMFFLPPAIDDHFTRMGKYFPGIENHIGAAEPAIYILQRSRSGQIIPVSLHDSEPDAKRWNQFDPVFSLASNEHLYTHLTGFPWYLISKGGFLDYFGNLSPEIYLVNRDSRTRHNLGREPRLLIFVRQNS